MLEDALERLAGDEPDDSPVKWAALRLRDRLDLNRSEFMTLKAEDAELLIDAVDMLKPNLVDFNPSAFGGQEINEFWVPGSSRPEFKELGVELSHPIGPMFLDTKRDSVFEGELGPDYNLDWWSPIRGSN